MSNFLCVEAYFAVPKWRFLHKINLLSQTAVSQFWHLSTQTVGVELWDDCVTIELASHQARADRVLFVTANRRN